MNEDQGKPTTESDHSLPTRSTNYQTYAIVAKKDLERGEEFCISDVRFAFAFATSEESAIESAFATHDLGAIGIRDVNDAVALSSDSAEIEDQLTLASVLAVADMAAASAAAVTVGRACVMVSKAVIESGANGHESIKDLLARLEEDRSAISGLYETLLEIEKQKA